MKCPVCGSGKSFVKDSRIENKARYRRRYCEECDHTWTTYEIGAAEYESLRMTAMRTQGAAAIRDAGLMDQLRRALGNISDIQREIEARAGGGSK